MDTTVRFTPLGLATTASLALLSTGCALLGPDALELAPSTTMPPQANVAPASPGPPPSPVQVDPDDLPPLPAQLTFLEWETGSVKRWSREGGAPRTLWRAGTNGEELCWFDVSRDSGIALVVAAVPGEESITCSEGQLRLFDESRAESVHLPTKGYLGLFALAPDGAHVAYVSVENVPHTHPDFDQDAQGEGEATLSSIATTAPHEVRILARCDVSTATTYNPAGCFASPIIFSADSQRVAFADERALWEAPIDGTPPRMIIEQQSVTHRFQDPSAYRGDYRPMSWSPDGARIIAAYLDVATGGNSPAIIEVATGTAYELPDSVDDHFPYSEFAWAPDGSALLISNWSWGDGTPPALRLLDVLRSDEATPLLADPGPSLTHNAYGPAVAVDGGLRFGLRHHDPNVVDGNGVFRSAADGSERVLLASLPPLESENDGPGDAALGRLSWSPDGDAFIAHYYDQEANRVLVGMADGSGLWDVDTVIGDSFIWSR